jgi:hypothetical protein
MSNLFLIMGTQRSGTTLLSKILSTHSEIFVQNETYLPRLFSNVEIKVESLVEKITNYIDKESKAYTLGKTVNLFGLKDPQLTDHMDIVNTLAESIKIIIIVRDPRGVVNSYIENKWGLGTNAYTGALRWKMEVRKQFELANAHSTRVLLIKYEDLFVDLESSLNKMCAFLDVKYEKDMCDFHENRKYVSVTGENKNINKKLDQSISEKWKNSLSNNEIGIIETVTQDEMHLLGYKPLTGTRCIGYCEKKLYEFHQLILGEIQLQFSLRRARFLNWYSKKR